MTKSIETLTWAQVRDDLKRVNPELVEIIDAISPDHRYPLIKARYAFGDVIVNSGQFQLPSSPGRAEIKKAMAQLNYSPIPLFLTLKKSTEVFIETQSRVIPLNLFPSGTLLGLFETLAVLFNRPISPKWNVSAGARSVFLLPKVTTSSGYNRLRRKYGVSSSTPLANLSDHWHVFSDIARKKDEAMNWQCEVLFFTSSWLESKKTDPAWFAFREYIFKHAWQQHQFAVEKTVFSFIWHAFIEAVAARNLKPRPYLADTVKHLLAVAAGTWPAFRPADERKEDVMPVRSIQEAFVDVYKLKQYLPTIMHPALLEKKRPVYYSLGYPTLVEGAPFSSKNAPTIISDLRDIKLMIETLNQQLKREGNSMLNQVAFDYFHSEDDIYQEIQASQQIAQEDLAFHARQAQYTDRKFCATSPFWRGCVRIKVSGK